MLPFLLTLAGGLVIVDQLTGCGLGCGGARAILHSAAAIVAVIGVLALAFCVGDAFLARWVHVEDARERLVFSTCLGSGVLSGCLVLLGLAGGLYGATIGALLLIALTLSWSRIRHLGPLMSESVQLLMARRNAASAICVSLTIGVLLYFLVTALLPPVDWDSLAYHLAVPKYFLAQHRVRLPPANLHAAYVGVVQMLYLPFLALNLETGPALLNAGFAVLLGVAVHGAAERFFGGDVADFALCGLWGSTSILLVAPTPRIDVTLALYLFSAHVALIHAVGGPRREVRWLYLAGALVGLSFGVKYHGALYGVALVPVLLAQPRWAFRERAELGRAILIAGGFAAPWLLKNFVLFGVPLYPFVAQPVLPPWFARLNGGRSLPEHFPSEAFHVLRQIRRPFNIRDFFLSPGRLGPDVEGPLYFANPLFFALPVLAAAVKWRPLALLAAPPIAYTAGLLLVSRYTNLRYLIPAFPALTVVAAGGAYAIMRRVVSTKRRHILAGGVALSVLLPSLIAADLIIRVRHPLGVIAGTESRQQYVERQLPSYFHARDVVSQSIGPRDNVLMLFEARSYYLDDRFIPDVMLLNWPRLNYIIRNGCISKRDVDIVLVNMNMVEFYKRHGMHVNTLGMNKFSAFAARCLGPATAVDGYYLYATR